MAREGRCAQGFDLEEGNDDDIADIDLLTPVRIAIRLGVLFNDRVAQHLQAGRL